MAVDPTYPLYPILSIVAAFFMFLILSHSLLRRSWNLAVTFLCIGLFFDNFIHGINAVVWRDNADIKVPVYCDLVSRLQFLMNFLPSITSLLITRRLHIISTLRDVEAPSRKTTRSTTELLEGNGISRTSYLRILALGCLDAAMTLLISITNLVSLFVTLSPRLRKPSRSTLDGRPITQTSRPSGFRTPPSRILDGTPSKLTFPAANLPYWLAIVIFALFGMTSSARSAYWSRIAMVGQLFGRKPPMRQSFALDSITFAAPGHPVDLPEGTSFDSLSESGPSDSAFESDSVPATSIPHFKTTSFTIPSRPEMSGQAR
ncbi:hypothetical protein DFH08DRAFT_1008807 [Mycena albidolilacea]|uniref:Pheromone receptor n=1 Tax=Mycena albidolilacea TaxID=1033008 RepID=A0AAD7ER39_9AGAR|nr:hypothetical protein DFH08DRAFT_1008807 [Mycena albidolilacea]